MSLKDTIESKLKASLTIHQMILTNESHQHNVPTGSESHFHLFLVSPDFEGVSRVARHQKIYGLLAEELKQGLHALRLQLHSLEEFEQGSVSPSQAPKCRGGSKG